MVKFSLKLSKGKSKDGSEQSREQAVSQRRPPQEVDAMFDERLSRVFENGINIPVGPDGRIRQEPGGGIRSARG